MFSSLAQIIQLKIFPPNYSNTVVKASHLLTGPNLWILNGPKISARTLSSKKWMDKQQFSKMAPVQKILMRSSSVLGTFMISSSLLTILNWKQQTFCIQITCGKASCLIRIQRYTILVCKINALHSICSILWHGSQEMSFLEKLKSLQQKKEKLTKIYGLTNKNLSSQVLIVSISKGRTWRTWMRRQTILSSTLMDRQNCWSNG